jgi:putative transcriptional regulator
VKRTESRSSVEERIIEGLAEFTQALQKGEVISDRFVCRRVKLDSGSKPYAPAMVTKARALLGVSQTLFAHFLGVSAKTVRAWEQGLNPPNRTACRFMDEIQKDPTLYRNRLKDMAISK